MIEDVKERRQAAVLGAQALEDQFAVDIGQNTLGTGQPHEVDHHVGGRVFVKLEVPESRWPEIPSAD